MSFSVSYFLIVSKILANLSSFLLRNSLCCFSSLADDNFIPITKATKSPDIGTAICFEVYTYTFTEQRVAMLSTVLNSERAIMVNIQIMRAFTKLREILTTDKELKDKLSELENKITKHDQDIQLIFDAIRKLIEPEVKSKRKIGFYVANEDVKNLKSFKGVRFYDE